MTNLVIANHTISQYNGFYSLNDLHRASGAEKKHQPALFFRNAEVQDLILEIERSTNLQNGEKSIAYHTIQGGNSKTTKQGTYACRELVYRYAMWISPKFSLMVIRAFDALNTGAIPCLAKTTADDRRLSATQIAQIRAAVKQVTSTGAVSYQYLYHAIST
ncbi:KilA-N domain-containing protein, partial [Moraxella cuniculi DSM 21768]